MREEESIWTGCSSQIVNIKAFAACTAVIVALVAATIVMLIYTEWGGWRLLPLAGAAVAAVGAGIKWLDIRCTRYELTTQRLRTTTGILSKRVDELELYRVKDIALRKPLILRVLKLGAIELTTSDHSTPVVLIRAIRAPEHLRDILRENIEAQRDRKRVKEIDVT